MSTFLINYDLSHEKEVDYQKLWAELRAQGATRVLWSTWLITKNNTQLEIANHFLRYMHVQDRILVVQCTGAAFKNTLADKAVNAANFF
jgi:hypothetical protein